MDSDVSEIIQRLSASRSVPLLRLIDRAGFGLAAPGDPDPAVVEPYRWLLARVGDGITLTKAGHLPPAVVTETMTTLGWDADWIGRNNREEQTLPVAELRDSARRMGLLRVQRGILLRTVAGRKLTDDPAALWWHIAEHLPLARDDGERQAGLLYLLTVAAGLAEKNELIAEGMIVLGWADSRTRQPLDPLDAFRVARDTWAVFRRLRIQPRTRWGEPDVPPTPAAVALARAALLGRTGAVAAERPSPRGRDDKAVELTITLRDIEPPVWRRVVVPASLTLGGLHTVIQTAMGWSDSHLHMFVIDRVRYGDIDDPGGDEQTHTVADVRVKKFVYEYDFGDSWAHDIRVGQRLASVGAGTPHCAGGARACPPEDCGGAWGYEHLLEVLADPSDEEHDEMLEWVGGEFDPEAFDVAATNELLELYDRHSRRPGR